MPKNKKRLVFFNEKFVPENEAKISIYDSALMFGDMVFEMTRSFKKKQFLLEQHIDRLLLGIKILRIPLKYSKKQIVNFCHQTIEKNDNAFEKDDEHRLMIDVSRGLLGIYHGVEGLKPGANLIIADFPLKWTVNGMSVLFDQGISAMIPSQRAIPATLMDPKIKNRSRLFYLMANIETSLFKGENNWALLLDTNGFISEGTGDNFFIVKNKKVFTPKGHNILRGISRDYVINYLCKKLKIEVYEKDLEPYDVYDADEAFMTGTPFCMLPVTSLNGLKIGDGNRGKIFNKILLNWNKTVGVNIEDQIKNWDKKNSRPATQLTPYKFK